MDLTQLSCEDFLSQLASKAPAPGGGGAAALVGAAGVALGNMVGNLTTGKKKYAAVEEEILVLNARAEALRKRLEALVQADADAFTPLAAAYGLPRETPEQQARKAAVLAEALDGACAVPLDIMDACCEGIRLAADYAEKGSVLAVSDAGCAALFCKAALQASALNVAINTKLMTDRDMPPHWTKKRPGCWQNICRWPTKSTSPWQAACGPDTEKGNVYVYHFEGCARRGRHERSKCRPLRRTAGKGRFPHAGRRPGGCARR